MKPEFLEDIHKETSTLKFARKFIDIFDALMKPHRNEEGSIIEGEKINFQRIIVRTTFTTFRGELFFCLACMIMAELLSLFYTSYIGSIIEYI